MGKNVPPHNTDAEKEVLGAVLKYREALEVAVENLTSDDFYDPNHNKIFKAIETLHNDSKVVDLITVANQLQRDKQLEKIGNRGKLADIAEYGISQNIENHTRIVQEKSALRKLIAEMTQLVHECYKDEDTAQKIIDKLESAVMKMATGKSADSCSHVKEIIPDNLEDLDKILRGEKEYLNTGYCDLDSLVVGLTPSDLIILAGRPAMGKSALAMNIAENLAKNGAPCGIFSLEMSKEQLTKRLQYGMARVSGKNAELGKITSDEMDKITNASNRLATIPIYIDDTAILTAQTLRSKARRMISKHGVQCIIVDYIQLMIGKGNNRTEEVGDISRALKLLAKELNVPVIALSQLSRACEVRKDKRPVLSDLRESGSIEQDADEVWFTYREVEYLKHLEVQDPKRKDKELSAEILVRKNRDGETGVVHLNFFSQYARFESISLALADGLV